MYELLVREIQNSTAMAVGRTGERPSITNSFPERAGGINALMGLSEDIRRRRDEFISQCEQADPSEADEYRNALREVRNTQVISFNAPWREPLTRRVDDLLA